jgi:hypothetical protein
LADGEKDTLRAVKEVKGGGHTGAMTGGIVATSLVFFPAAPFFLFMHGKDTSIPKGTEITAYTNGDMQLDIKKFQALSSGEASHPGTADSTRSDPVEGKLSIMSIPDAADIEIDGGFVGNTPSEVTVPSGDHVLAVTKAGFKRWERKLRVSSGSSVHINAQLEKAE